MTEDRLYTPIEVARHLGLAETTVWRLGRSGSIPAVRIGRRMRFRASDVTAFEERNLGRAVPRRRSGAA